MRDKSGARGTQRDDKQLSCHLGCLFVARADRVPTDRRERERERERERQAVEERRMIIPFFGEINLRNEDLRDMLAAGIASGSLSPLTHTGTA